MIHVWVAVLGTSLASFLAFVIGIGLGQDFIKNNLLKEGFYIDREPMLEIGHGNYELYRRNTEEKWVRIKNIELGGRDVQIEDEDGDVQALRGGGRTLSGSRG